MDLEFRSGIFQSRINAVGVILFNKAPVNN